MNSFKGRSLCVIDDFSKKERLYLFSQVRSLKEAIAADDSTKMDNFTLTSESTRYS